MPVVVKPFKVGNVDVGGGELFLIAGPCLVENETHTLKMAEALRAVTDRVSIPFIFKASYDKANRTSINSHRGLGIDEGLRILSRVRKDVELHVLTDVHETAQIRAAAEVADVLQIPAFLSRQTDLIVEAARSNRAVNIKKGQFLAPNDMKNAIEKVTSQGNDRVILTERGSSFGYNNLVVDFRALPIMRAFGYPVVFDATHSVQLPGGQGDRSGGERQYVQALARAAVAVGIDALFMEIHEDPDRTLPDGRPLSDGPNMLRLDDLPQLLDEIAAIGAGR